MVSNRVHGVRCALCWNPDSARLAREHNDANVLSLGARMMSESEALRYVDIFVSTPFSGDSRHIRRIAQLAAFEKDGSVP